jgi:hypothetical protein
LEGTRVDLGELFVDRPSSLMSRKTPVFCDLCYA